MTQLGPYPAFGWSHSRQRRLHCARLYYYTVYGMWQGWSAAMVDPAWLSYRLRCLAGSPRQHVGILVHDAAREVVRRIVRRQPLPEYRTLVARGWAELIRLRDQELEGFLLRPQHDPMLRSVFYGEPTDVGALVRDAHEHLDRCLTALLESSVLTELEHCDPTQVLATDALDSIPLRIDGQEVTVWAAPDLAYWTPPDYKVLTVLDWKTGEVEGAEEQLAVYALYVAERHGITPAAGRFRGRVVALGAGGQETVSEITPA